MLYSQLLINSQIDFAHLRKLEVTVIRPTAAKLCAVGTLASPCEHQMAKKLVKYVQSKQSLTVGV